MKPIRLALFVVLLIFHCIVVFLSLRFTPSLAEGIVRDPGAFRFLAVFGLVVFLITFAVVWFDRRATRKKIARLEAEKDRIKAEVFDREQRARERELEIEREINSFQQSLPDNAPSAVPGSTSSYSDEPDLTAPLASPRVSQPKPLETDQVEYAPLKPKSPDVSSGADEADQDSDTNPFRS